MNGEMTTFEDIVTSKILEALGDYTISHPTMISNIIREEMIKYNVKPIGHIDEDKLDKLADKLNPNNPHGDNYEVGQYFGFQDGFKAGYEKAMEE